MKNTEFKSWLAGVFGQAESELDSLLSDKTAVKFLIAWSIFESKCFSGFVKNEEINSYAEHLIEDEHFDVSSISDYAKYFHNRYQDKNLRNNLLHGSKSIELEAICKVDFLKLKPRQVVYFSTFVVYRFRNNIFHGNKGVSSWLKFTEQISYCTLIMQLLISHAESVQCTLKPINAS